MIVCIFEDRPKNLIGVKLAALSLAKYCPELPIIISCPNPSVEFKNWIEKLSNVTLVTNDHVGGIGWNIKPTILLKRLSEGYSDVLWIDSDIIINQDFRSYFCCLSANTLVTAEDLYWKRIPKQEKQKYTIAWSMEHGRILPETINSGIVRVTACHVKLLQTWQKLLQDPTYINAQNNLTHYQRPLHMRGDQEVLSALLDSVNFAHIPVKILKCGIDIAHCAIFGGGYTPTERLNMLISGKTLPMFIHSPMYKPWQKPFLLAQILNSQESLKDRLWDLYVLTHLELSPYTVLARQYRNQLEEEVSWMNLTLPHSKLLSLLFANHPTLQGLPFAILDALTRHSRQFLRNLSSV